MMVAKRSVVRSGFSLPEIILAVSIFMILTVFVIANFDRGRKAQDLRQAASLFAQDIRSAQAQALAGQTIGGVVPKGGFGVRIAVNATTYTLFSDAGNVLDLACQRYDADEELPSGVKSFPKDVKISALAGDISGSPPLMDITFTPPQGTAFLNAVCTPGQPPVSTDNTATITLLHSQTGVTRTISVNRLSGQVSAQ